MKNLPLDVSNDDITKFIRKMKLTCLLIFMIVTGALATDAV